MPAALTGEALAAIAIEAGALIMQVFEAGCDVAEKPDCSPVTEADTRAEALILARLAELAPHVPVIAEEAFAGGHIPAPADTFLLVDPLDGTSEFVAHLTDFTVNIALIEQGVPVLAVVYAPATARLFVADSPTQAWRADVAPGGRVPPLAERRTIHVRAAPTIGLTAVASRRNCTPETEDILARFPIVTRAAAGSSLKFCLVAAGEADIYPRCGRTMEWDTAAGHAIVTAAGGAVLTLDGEPLGYGKHARGYDNPGFIVLGDATLASVLDD